MEGSVEEVSRDLVRNIKRFNSLVDLKKVKVDFVDYTLLLDDIGVSPKPISEFKENSSGIFFNDVATVIETPTNTLFFTELYAEEGEIKFLRLFEEQKPDIVIVKDTYLCSGLETTLVHELCSDYIDNNFMYPKLSLKKESFYPGLEKIDSLEKISDVPEKQHFYYEDDDYEEDFSRNFEGYRATHKQSFQTANYFLSDYVLATLIHDDDSSMSLVIQNSIGPILSQKYYVKSTNALAINTQLPFKDIRALDEILLDESNKEKDILQFITDWFKDHDATIINTYKAPQIKKFYEGMKMLNIKDLR